MKTSYRPNKTPAGLWPLLLLLCLWLGGAFWYGPLSGVALWLVKPLWNVGNAAVTSDSVTQQLTDLRLRLADHDALVAENASLRAVLGHYPSPSQVVVARILSHPWTSPYDLSLVDSGQDNTGGKKVMIGQEVLIDNAVALGQVVAVDNTTAKIKLFSAGGSELPVLVGTSSLPIIAHGRGGGNFVIELPREAPIKVGDQVSTRWQERDLVVGTVGAIDKDPSASLQKIYFNYPFNLNELNLVEIQTL